MSLLFIKLVLIFAVLKILLRYRTLLFPFLDK